MMGIFYILFLLTTDKLLFYSIIFPLKYPSTPSILYCSIPQNSAKSL